MNLVELATGVFAYIHPSPAFGRSNVGLLIDADGLTVFDTTASPSGGDLVRHQILELTAQLELPIKRVVLSSSRIAFSGGGAPFWSAAFYGSDTTSEQLDAPPNPMAFRRLLPEFADQYPEDFATRPITHTVSEEAWLTGASFAVPLPGESSQNLTLRLEGPGVVFAGALASFGVTPLTYDADLLAWITSLEQLKTMGRTIIPGHGMPGGIGDVDDLIGYLTACIEANGEPSRIGKGPWDRWTDRRFDAVNVERAASMANGINEVPQAMFKLLGIG